MTTTDMDAMDLMETFKITKIESRWTVGGRWVTGTIGGYGFEALVFPEHAQCADYELADSRISKLWVQQVSGGATVASFDRGWDIHPTTPSAQQIVELLAEGLAEFVYAE